MDLYMEEVFSGPNFHPKKFIHMLANDKDAADMLSKRYLEFTKMNETSNERITKVFAHNHESITLAANEADKIEKDINELRNTLIDQSKSIFDMSVSSDITFISNQKEIFKTHKQEKSCTPYNIEEALETKKLMRDIDTLIIRRHYAEIPSIIAVIERHLTNLDYTIRLEYQRGINERISQICDVIFNQIKYMHPLLLEDEYSIDSMLMVLKLFKQDDLAIELYLSIVSNSLRDELKNFQIQKRQTYMDAITVPIKNLFNSIEKAKSSTSLKFSSANFNVIFFYWVDDLIKSFIKRMFLQFSAHSISFFDGCKSYKLLYKESAVIIPAVGINIHSIIKKCLSPILEKTLGLLKSQYMKEIEILLGTKYNSKDIELNQQQIDLINTISQYLLEKDTISPSFAYVCGIYHTIINNCQEIMKTKIIQNYLESILIFCLKCMDKSVRELKNNEAVEYKKNMHIFNNNVFAQFKQRFPKSRIFEENIPNF